MTFRYSIVPAGAITDPRIEPRDLQVLALLGRYNEHGGWLWRNQSRMANELSVGRRTIQRSLDRLVDAGWVEKRARGYGDKVSDPDKQPFASLEYRVKLDNDVPVENPPTDQAEGYEVSADAGRCVTDDAPPVTDDAPGASRMAHKKEPLGFLVVEESACARESLIDPEAFELTRQIKTIAGHAPDDWPPGWSQATHRVTAFLREGYHPEILLVAAREVMANHRGEPPWSIGYFEKAFARAKARQQAPLPAIPINETSEARRGSINSQSNKSVSDFAGTLARRMGGSTHTSHVLSLPKGRLSRPGRLRDDAGDEPAALPDGGGRIRDRSGDGNPDT